MLLLLLLYSLLLYSLLHPARWMRMNRARIGRRWKIARSTYT